MNDQYLWDRSGEPDPEVERLEELLRPLADGGTPRRKRGRPRWAAWLALAAALLLCVAGVYFYRAQNRPGWESSEGRLALGEWITTQKDVRLDVASIGRLDVAPGSRLRIESSRRGDYRVRLAHGRMEALILAPPREFVVETPSAATVDLGCAYTLEVDKSGLARVSVRSGWVAFERDGQEVFIPAGARCRTSRRFGLGVPVWADADPELVASVEAFEEKQVLALPEDLRPKDGLTLWHLLRRVPPAVRSGLLDRFNALVPNGVPRERVLAGDRAALDTLWASLQLGDSDLWRKWRRRLN